MCVQKKEKFFRCTTLISLRQGNLPRLILFEVRLCRQQPINRILRSTRAVPDAMPIKSKRPDAPPIPGAEVVGGPPNDEAG